MPTRSDLIDLCDELVTVLQTNNPAVDVARAYRQELDLGKFTGRKVRIFPKSYTSPDVANRREIYWSVNLIIVVAERYEPAGFPPNDWIDELVTWTEQNIFNVFGNVEPFRLGKYWSDTANVTAVYDWDLLNEDKVFWSETELTFVGLVS